PRTRPPLRLKPGGLLLCHNESVDWCMGPFGALYRRLVDRPQRLKRPVVPRLFGARIEHVGAVGPFGSLVDPRTEQADFLRAERLPLGGHDIVLVDRADHMNEAAVRAVTRNQYRALVAPFHDALPDAEVESPLFVPRGMAFEAALSQQWLHVLDEIDRLRAG